MKYAHGPQEALDTYNDVRGESDTLETDIIALIADLLLLAQFNHLDVTAIQDAADIHFQAEMNDR